jgi:hypothetical protein
VRALALYYAQGYEELVSAGGRLFMKKLLLYTLLAAGSATPVALYAAHEHELPALEEQEIEFDANSELVPVVSDYERHEQAIRQVFPLKRIPLRLVMQYADNSFYIDPYYNSVNFGNDAELNPTDNLAQKMRYVAERTKKAIKGYWDNLNLPPIAQYEDPLLIKMACDIKGAVQRRSENQHEIAALELGIVDSFPNSTLGEQDRRAYMREGLRNLGAWQNWLKQSNLKKWNPVLSNRRADIEFLISGVIQNKQKYSFEFRDQIAQQLKQHPLLALISHKTKHLLAGAIGDLKWEQLQLKNKLAQEDEGFVVID